MLGLPSLFARRSEALQPSRICAAASVSQPLSLSLCFVDCAGSRILPFPFFIQETTQRTNLASGSARANSLDFSLAQLLAIERARLVGGEEGLDRRGRRLGRVAHVVRTCSREEA